MQRVSLLLVSYLMCWIKAAVGVFPFAKMTSAKIVYLKKGNHRRVNSFHIKSCPPSGTCADTHVRDMFSWQRQKLTSVIHFKHLDCLKKKKRTICAFVLPTTRMCLVNISNKVDETHQGKVKLVKPSHTGCWLCIETSSRTGRCQWANRERKINIRSWSKYKCIPKIWASVTWFLHLCPI